MISLFLYPLISIPTRITKTSKSLIDNIFVNSLHFCQSGCVYSDLSDHLPIFGSLHFKNSYIPSKIPLFSRVITDEKIQNFKQELSSSLSLNIQDDNPDSLIERFTLIFNSLTDKNFPLKLVSKKKTPRQPWMTQGLLQSVIKKTNYTHNLKNFIVK